MYTHKQWISRQHCYVNELHFTLCYKQKTKNNKKNNAVTNKEKCYARCNGGGDESTFLRSNLYKFYRYIYAMLCTGIYLHIQAIEYTRAVLFTLHSTSAAAVSMMDDGRRFSSAAGMGYFYKMRLIYAAHSAPYITSLSTTISPT